MKLLFEKLKDSFLSVFPITLIVVILHLTGLCKLENKELVLFLVSAACLIIGMSLFTLGADIAMMPMGSSIGSSLTKTKKIWIIVLLAFSLGTLITLSEPDLAVLASQVPIDPDILFVIIISVGVGLFLVIGILRILFQKSLNILLIVFYALVFMMANLCNSRFLPLSFDSGGVTTGPMTVPFIMAMCAGFAAVRGGKKASEDSFGLIALCSVGPIFIVVLLGIFFKGDPIYNAGEVHEVTNIFSALGYGFLEKTSDVAVALLPIVAFFFIYQAINIKLPKKQLIKIIIGVVYTFFGLILFLGSVEVGFSPVGLKIGKVIAGHDNQYLIVLLGGCRRQRWRRHDG